VPPAFAASYRKALTCALSGNEASRDESVLLMGAEILPGMITLKAGAQRHPEGASAASGLDCYH
jgi:hypothetical protein